MNIKMIIDSFKELSEYEFKLGNKFKAIAFRKSMNMIINCVTYKIIGDRVHLINPDDTTVILGSSSSKVFIDQINKGHCDRIDLIQIESSTDLEDLTNISGIGEVKKAAIIKSGISKVSELVKLNLSVNHPIPGTNIKFTQGMNTGLKLFLATKNKRITHDKAYEYCRNFKDTLINNNIKNFEMYVLGSYRRGKPTVGDIDIVLVNEKDKIIEGNIRLVVKNWFDDIFINGDSKKSGVKGETQVDVRFIERQYLGAHILHGTGSQEFNIQIRAHAKNLGYRLNEMGIVENGKLITFDSEKAIFKFLGLKYVSPQDR